MALTRQRDGSVVIREKPLVLRVSMIVLAMVVPWAVFWAAPTSAQDDPLRNVLGLVAGGFFLLIALLAESRSFHFDAERREIRWSRSRILSSRSGILAFDAVTAVVAQPRMDADNPRARRVTYQPVLLTTMGEMPLSNTSSLKAEDYAEVLSAVGGVLGLGVADQDDAVRDLVRAGRIEDAVALLRRRTGDPLEQARRVVGEMGRSLGDHGRRREGPLA
jgi:hypothetical protein